MPTERPQPEVPRAGGGTGLEFYLKRGEALVAWSGCCSLSAMARSDMMIDPTCRRPCQTNPATERKHTRDTVGSERHGRHENESMSEVVDQFTACKGNNWKSSPIICKAAQKRKRHKTK